MLDKTSCQLQNTSTKTPPPSHIYQYWILIFNNSPKCALPHTSTSSLLKQITHCLTVLTSTVWFMKTFSKHRWVLYFFLHERIQWHFCFMENFMSNAILPDYLVATCNNEKKMGISCNDSISIAIPLLVSAKSQCSTVGGITFSCHRITTAK